MADSAPAMSSERQSVPAHQRVGMRRNALLRPQRPAHLAIFATTLALSLFNCSTALSAPQEYVVCKEPQSELCITWMIEIEDAIEIARQIYHDGQFMHHCGLSNLIPLPPHQKFVTVTPFEDKLRSIIFCKTAKVLIKGANDWTSAPRPVEAAYRVRRQTGHPLRGRYRGQTQSQYVAIEHGSDKDNGKAEAHSAADSSRASVSGSSGMGQAQSQTMYDPSCEDCVGRSELEAAESLKRRPYGAGQGGASTGTPTVGGTLPGGNGAFGPLGSTQGVNGIYGPTQSGGPGGGPAFRPGQAGTPGGNGVFGPSQIGIPGANGVFRPNQGATPAGNGVYGPNLSNVPAGTSPGGFGPNQIGMPGSGGFGPSIGGMPGGTGAYGPNQHGVPGAGTGTYGPNQSGLPGGNGVFGPSHGGAPGGTGTFSPNQHGLPGGPGTGAFGPHQGTPPGVSGVYGPSQSGSPGTTTFGPSQHGLPGGSGTGGYGPNQNGLPGGTGGFITTPGGSPSGTGSYGPNQQGATSTGPFGPNLVVGTPSGVGTIGPTQNGVLGGTGPGNVGPNQGGLPNGNSGFGPILGNVPNGLGGAGIIGPNQHGLPGGTSSGNQISGPIQGGAAGNWPTTGTFQGPDGTTYYCCVAGPNNNPQYFKMGGSGFGTPGSPGSGPYGSGNEQNGLHIPNIPYGTGSTSGPNNLLAPNGAYGTGPAGGNFGFQAPIGPYTTGTGGQSGLQTPNGPYGTGPSGGHSYTGPYGSDTIGGLQQPNGQYNPGISGGQNGLGTNGQYSPGTTGGQSGLRPGGQYGPGSSGSQNGLQVPSAQYGPGGTGGGNGGLHGPSGQYSPGITGGQNNIQGPSGPYGAGLAGGQSGLHGPSGQYGPGITGGQNSLQGPSGQYGPGISGGQNGFQGPNGQYTPGSTGGQNGLQGPSGQYGSGTNGGPSGLSGSTGQYGPGGNGGQSSLVPNGQFGAGNTGGQNTLQGSGGQYSPGATGGTNGLGHNGQFGPGAIGGPNSQYAPGTTGGQNGYGTPSGPYGTGSVGGQYGPYGTGTVGGQNGPGPYGHGATGGQNQVPAGTGPYGSGQQGTIDGQNLPPNGQYGPGQGSRYPQQYANGILGAGQNGNGPYGYDNKGNIGQNVDYTGAPQNVIDPNSIGGAVDGDDSEAEASVSQAANGTVANASSKGGNDKGRAQTHVHGAYTGAGEFSAQAEITGENKAANSEVTGGKKGASSNAQGSGRNNKSQANVQLGSETGSVLTGSQSEGVMHSSNTQVQGSVKGGMADAQARGPGSTSSQAQIGFTPYKDGDKSHELQKTPFIGGGIAAAQSSGRTGSSQSQLRGTFKYGITYNGAAQAGASLDKDTVFPNRLPFDKIDVNDESNKNINVDTERTEKPSDLLPEKLPVLPVEENPSIPENPTEIIPSTDMPFESKLGTEAEDEALKDPEAEYGTHTHSDHHKTDVQSPTPTRSPPVESRRSFPSTSSTNSGDYEYATDKDGTPPEDYDVDDGFGPEGADATEVEQGEYNNYNEFSRDSEATHQSLHIPKRKGLEVRQTSGGNTQHIVLGSLTDQDAEITQKNSERPDESRVYQPGERVPGTGGYTIPIGFTGSVKSVASKEKTYVVGSKDSPSQAQTVSLTPGSGKIKYTYPSTYARNIHPKDLRSLHPKLDESNRYVSVSKSVTRDLDGENNIRKQYSHTYFTKSSSCGYFTFTCTMVSDAEGRKKVCKPKIPTNPDGTPMRC